MSTHSPLASFPPSQESGRRPYKLPMCAESAYYVKITFHMEYIKFTWFVAVGKGSVMLSPEVSPGRLD